MNMPPQSRSGAVNDGEPYISHTDPVPIDLYSEGPAGPAWYRIPSWRIEFTCEALKGVDCRVHRGLGHEGQWTLSEASTGFKMFGELPDDHGTAEGMLAEFCAGRMLKLTPELVATSIAKAKEILKEKMPSPFAPRSENRTQLPICLECEEPRECHNGDYCYKESKPLSAPASSARTSNAIADELEALHAQATPGPWAWDQRGEKVNEWGLGTAFDANEKQLAGRFHDEEAIYDEYVCSHEAATCNYKDPALICALRNNLPAIIAALRATPSATSPTIELLKRIRQWDMLDATADGPYWKREIDAVLGGEAEGRGA